MPIKLIIASCICLAITFFSCQSNTTKSVKKNIKADGKMLADLQCQAKQLQNERYALADAIRFLEDSVKMSASEASRQAIYQSRLDSLNGTTDNMWRRTKAMADSITHTLERLHENSYHSKEDRKKLDEAMAAAYQQHCRE